MVYVRIKHARTRMLPKTAEQLAWRQQRNANRRQAGIALMKQEELVSALHHTIGYKRILTILAGKSKIWTKDLIRYLWTFLRPTYYVSRPPLFWYHDPRKYAYDVHLWMLTGGCEVCSEFIRKRGYYAEERDCDFYTGWHTNTFGSGLPLFRRCEL